MPFAAAVRRQVEFSIAARNPAALSPRIRPQVECLPCGIRVLDELLQGGIPIGVVTEFIGTACSGRTTMALAYVAAMVRTGAVCAWVDVSDAIAPECVAASGVDLERLLWVRCGTRTESISQELTSPSIIPTADKDVTALPRHPGGGSAHPRSEGRNMPEAISAMMQAHGGFYDKMTRRESRSIGTPGAPNRPLTQKPAPHKSEHREEQVNSDRLPPRRGENLSLAPRSPIPRSPIPHSPAPRCAEPQHRRLAAVPSPERISLMTTAIPAGKAPRKPWPLLDQALRATDLLLQGGGFSMIVLDLGSTLPEAAWRIPMATWFRFRAACERTRVSLVLLTQHPCARSSAELVVQFEPGSLESEGRVMTGVRYRGEPQRNRSHERDLRVVPIRKPPQSERPGTWRCGTAWGQLK